MFKRSKFRGFIKNMDFILAALTFAAAVFGIIMISSAGGENGGKYVICLLYTSDAADDV